VRRAWLATPLLLVVSPAPAVAADPLWSVKASASGTYALDYGRDGDEVDGLGTGSWSWRMKAVAEGTNIDTDIAIFRMHVEETSDIVLTPTTPYCRPSAESSIGWVRDSRVGLYLSSSGGFQVNHPFFDLVEGCHAGAHGMSLYDGAAPAETRIPRGALRPRKQRRFVRTWAQDIDLPPGHESGPPHAFRASGTITIRLARLSKRGARALRLRLRSTPRTPRA
jgi:hypothetical protein